jgi:hypothetical protein
MKLTLILKLTSPQLSGLLRLLNIKRILDRIQNCFVSFSSCLPCFPLVLFTRYPSHFILKRLAKFSGNTASLQIRLLHSFVCKYVWNALLATGKKKFFEVEENIPMVVSSHNRNPIRSQVQAIWKRQNVISVCSSRGPRPRSSSGNWFLQYVIIYPCRSKGS